ncbi:SPW repeat protein [Bradyrhizobium sp.]|uniref:SPW repeat protein n=1 Tax=Bradyrhizobium sp. TaxID=376 RepID=UPI003BB14644
MLKWRRESVLDIYNLVLALFLFVTPWLFTYANEDAKIDLWATSALIAVISFTTFIAFSNWEEWFNLLLGIWLVGSPWVLGFTHTRAMHYSIGIGAVVAFLAALEIWLVYNEASERGSASS